MEAPPAYRYRLTFSKDYPVKYLGHLDMVTSWTRTFRRAGLPLAYSQGFNPQAKLQVAASLPVGTMGQAEVMDIYLTESLSTDDVAGQVRASLPPGFGLSAVEAVAPKAPTLQNALLQADYTVAVETNLPAEALQTKIDALLAAPEVMQTRIRRKRQESFNLRPLLHSLRLVSVADGEATLAMRVSTGQHGNLRPEAVLKALGLSEVWHQSTRTQLFFSFDN